MDIKENTYNESQPRHHVWVDPQKHLKLNKLSAEILSLSILSHTKCTTTKEKHSIVNMFLYNRYVHNSDYDSKGLWSKQAGLIIIYNEIQVGGRKNGWGALKLSVSVAFFFFTCYDP